MDSVELVPSLAIQLGGAPLDEEDLGAIGSVSVSRIFGAPAQCELRFCEPSSKLCDELRSWGGRELRVELGEAGDELFQGEVTAVELRFGARGERDVWVRAYDRLYKLRCTQSVRMHVDATVAELAGHLAQPHGLDVRSAQPGPLARERAQVRENDLAFLERVAREVGLYVTLDGAELALLTLEGEGEPVPLTLGENLIDAHVEINSEPVCGSVECHGWSPAYARSASASADRARGPDRPVAGGAPRWVGRERVSLTDRSADDVGHAQARAQAELDRSHAAGLTVHGRAQGEPRLRPGARVELQGLAEGLAGPYVLTEVRHQLDAATGFLTHFSTLPPEPSAERRGASLTLGRVTRLDDPDKLGRVRVELPAYAGIETGWLQVSGAGAGPKKGFAFLPDLDDWVLVLFAHDDPAEGVVLGGLYAESAPLDAGVESAGVRRSTWQSAKNQRIQIDDERGITTISGERFKLDVRSGSELALDEKQMRVHAATDLVIEAPGRRIVFRARRIDFEEASSA